MIWPRAPGAEDHNLAEEDLNEEAQEHDDEGEVAPSQLSMEDGPTDAVGDLPAQKIKVGSLKQVMRKKVQYGHMFTYMYVYIYTYIYIYICGWSFSVSFN